MSELYDLELRRAGAADLQSWRSFMRPVLGVLAAAGAGPVLPINLLCNAVARLGGPARASRVRDVLVDLRGLVVRSSPGTDEEHVGLFHQTFAEHLSNPSVEFSIDVNEAHESILSAISELAPIGGKGRESDYRYAAAAEASHLWELQRYSGVVDSLAQRSTQVPAENLARWRSWYDRFESTFSKNHPDTLTIRHNVAYHTGEAGDVREALRLLKELLPDHQKVLGKDDPATLRTRNNIAHCTGETGDAKEALRLYKELLPDREKALGKNDPETLRTRNNIAQLTGETGDAGEALRLLKELLPDQESVLEKDHPEIFITRNNIAHWTGETGDAREALRLYKELLPEREKVLGKEHPDVLTTRNNIAHSTGETGDTSEALRLFGELLPDLERVLGKEHPHTLTTRISIARWTNPGMWYRFDQ